MKILLDECAPRVLRHEFRGHIVETVASMGWLGMKNGELLRRATSQHFEAFVTTDKKLRHEQNIPAIPFPIILLGPRSNKVSVLRPLIPQVVEVLERAEAGRVYVIEGK